MANTDGFMDILFPSNISYGAVGGGGWSTRVVVTDSGREYRQALWNATRGRWQVGHNLRTPAEWAVLVSFHRLTQGKAFGFRFLDWTDYQDGGNGVIQNNVNGVLQLTKQYSQTDIVSEDVYTNIRYLTRPVPGTISCFLNSEPVTPTIDYTTGLVTNLTVGPTDVATWTGQFHVPVRFDTDEPELSMDIPNGVGWKGIPLLELRGA